MHKTPFVTNPAIAFAMRLGLLKKPTFRIYNYTAKRLNRPFAAHTYFGARILCDPRDYIQRMIFSFGFWEPHLSAYIQQVLRPGDVFVDVGANIGYYSLLASTLVGPSGAVIAVEASSTIFKLLLRNLTDNLCQNVTAINLAASDNYGKLDLFLKSSASLGETTTLASRGFARSEKIASAPLSAIIPPPLTRRVHVVKIDVEGAEIPVMRDLLSNLDRFNPDLQIIAEVSVGECRRGWLDVIARMRFAGFSTYRIANEYDDDAYLTWRTPESPRPLSDLPPEQFDILFKRESKAAFADSVHGPRWAPDRQSAENR